jgi:hypothetical protein
MQEYLTLKGAIGRSRRSKEPPLDLAAFLRSPRPTRWVARRKAAVVLAVRAGLVTLSEACSRYMLSEDEFARWEAAFDDEGRAGLHLKRYARTTGKELARAALPLGDLPQTDRSTERARIRPPTSRVGGPDISHLRTLIARAEAIVRAAEGVTESIPGTGKFDISLNRRCATDCNQTYLTPKEYALLKLLDKSTGVVLSKETLLNHLYGERDAPEIKIIDVFICKLRKKLAQATNGRLNIETVWGRGYRLYEAGCPLWPN